MNNTRDLSYFGAIEREEAARLLQLYRSNNDNTSWLSDNVAVEFNPYSGNVFLVDEDYNVGMSCLDDDGSYTLEDFLSCPNCGYEEIKPNFLNDDLNDCCKEYYNELYK